jgi:hypothetical protein
LDRGAVRDGFVGVDGFRGFFAEEFFDELLDFGDTRGSADEDDLGERDVRGMTVSNRSKPPSTARLTSLISSFLIPASLRTCSTGFIVFLNRSIFNSSNLALVSVSEKSFPPSKDSISSLVDC